MLALITSCGRFDLLDKTLRSLQEDLKFPALNFIVHEDSGKDPVMTAPLRYCSFVDTGKIGQHASIQQFLFSVSSSSRYYLHLEDDWEFNNRYDWIGDSIKILESDDKIIKVLARDNSPHPCEHNRMLERYEGDSDPIIFGDIHPWMNNGILWHGFSWNPGVTRMDLLRKFVPFPKYEQELAEQIHAAGYKVVELARPVYDHIGDGRSTHE